MIGGREEEEVELRRKMKENLNKELITNNLLDLDEWFWLFQILIF